MLVASVMAAWILVPPAAPTQDGRTVGPFRVEQTSGLQWPGVLHPTFMPKLSKRWVHRFSLSLDIPEAPLLESLRFDMISMGPALDPKELQWDQSMGGGSSRPILGFEGGVLLPGPRRVRVGVAKTLTSVAGFGLGALGRRTVFVNGRL